MQHGHEPTNSLAVKLYTIVILAISTYYTDATKSPLPCEGMTPGEGWLHRPFQPPPHPALSSPRGRGKYLVNSMGCVGATVAQASSL